MGNIISRKKATSIMFSALDNFWQRAYLIPINNLETEIKSPEIEIFYKCAEKIRINANEFEQTLNLLDTENFHEYYKKTGNFAKRWKLYNWETFQNCVPVKIEDLNRELQKHDKTNEKIELVDSFTVEELYSEKFLYESKYKLLVDYLNDFCVSNETENAVNKVLLSFTPENKTEFIQKLGTDNKLLARLMKKVNGFEKDEMLTILGEMFIEAGFTNGSAVKSINNKKDDIVEGTYEKDHMYITVSSPQDYGVRDYRTAPKQTFTAKPLELISMNYDGREITLPAILLAKSWENSLSTPEGIFYNYDKEDVDWNSLTDAKKDEYFAEFVEHYLPAGFLKALGNPIQLLIMACLTIVTTGLFAELEAALTAAGIAMSVIDGGAAVYGIVKAGEMKAAAITVHEAKKAAKVMAENIAKLTVDAVNIIVAVAGNKNFKPRNSNFRYRNNPSENPKVLRDAMEDSSAVYGYSPRNGSQLEKYATNPKTGIDWSNPEKVKLYRERRETYHKKNDNIDKLVLKMRKEGFSSEEIARAANKQRNQNRLDDYINDPEGLKRVKERNLREYKNEFGLSADDAYVKYGCNWEKVIEKTQSANPGMDACCGLYDKYFYLYENSEGK